MATTRRSVVLRSSPVLLLALVLALFAVPVSSGHPAGPCASSVSSAGTPSVPARTDLPAAPPAIEGPASASRASFGSTPGEVRVLRAQLTAGAAGSRAPPAGLA